jgi:hypothetical protein
LIGVSVSGSNSLAIKKPPGAAIKLAAIRYFISIPSKAYPANTEPATDDKPPTITAKSSERVIDGMKGLTIKGASVCPTKIFPAALIDSGRLVPNNFCNPPPIIPITNFITPM